MSNGKIPPLLSDAQLEQIALRFRVLGEPMRLRILQHVCRGARPVGDIVRGVRAGQANVSKHLALLAAAGVLTRRKQGQCVYYGMKDPLVMKLCALVHQHLAS